MSGATLIGIYVFVGMIAAVLLGVPIFIAVLGASALGLYLIGGIDILFLQYMPESDDELYISTNDDVEKEAYGAIAEAAGYGEAFATLYDAIIQYRSQQ